MPRTGTKRHRLVRRLLWATVAVVLVFALLPVWFPWVLKPVLSRFHLRITNYHRTGYTRFTLGGVTGEWNNSRLNVGRIESILPNAWLWRKFTERTKGPPWIIVRDGDLVITPSSAESPRTDTAKRTESLDDALDQTARIARLLRGTLPVAELTNCSIQIASNRFAIPHADWHGGRLSGVVDLPFQLIHILLFLLLI